LRGEFGVKSALLAGRLGSDAGLMASVGRHIPGGLRNSLARWLLANQSFCRHTVVENWFLHAA